MAPCTPAATIAANAPAARTCSVVLKAPPWARCPKIAAGQNGDDGRSHLRTKKLLPADAAGSRQREARPAQNTEDNT